MTAEIIALPITPAPVNGFHYGDMVCVDGMGSFEFRSFVIPSSGEPIAKLSRGDGGAIFVRIGRVTLWETKT